MSLDTAPQDVAACTVTGLKYWKWLDHKVIVMVTHKQVLHWNIEDGNGKIVVVILTMLLSAGNHGNPSFHVEVYQNVTNRKIDIWYKQIMKW